MTMRRYLHLLCAIPLIVPSESHEFPNVQHRHRHRHRQLSLQFFKDDEEEKIHSKPWSGGIGSIDITKQKISYDAESPFTVRELEEVVDDDRHGGGPGEDNASNQPFYFSTSPSAKPSAVPSPGPTYTPTTMPSFNPTVTPTNMPSGKPSVIPTTLPSITPTTMPSFIPTVTPTNIPSRKPSVLPTMLPSITPSLNPTTIPTNVPSLNPTITPTKIPSSVPSKVPTTIPSFVPTLNPCNDLSSGVYGNTTSESTILVLNYGYEVAIDTNILVESGHTFFNAVEEMERALLQNLVAALFTECSDTNSVNNDECDTSRNVFKKRNVDADVNNEGAATRNVFKIRNVDPDAKKNKATTSDDKIGGISSKPWDVATGGTCSVEEGSTADKCYVMSGAVSIYLPETFNGDTSIYSQMVITNIANIMDTGKLTSCSHPAIVDVKYLDSDTMMQYGANNNDRGQDVDLTSDQIQSASVNVVPVALTAGASGALFLFAVSTRYRYYAESRRLANMKQDNEVDGASTEIDDYVEVLP